MGRFDGQTLSPNRDVNAPAGIGGSKWGANGGAIAPSGMPQPVLHTMATGQRQSSYDNRLGVNITSVLADLAKTQLQHQTVDMTADDNTGDVTVDSLSRTTTSDSGL